VAEVGGVFVLLGLLCGIPVLFHAALEDTFGERTAENLKQMGFKQAASKWDKARGVRVTRIAMRTWAAVGVLVLASGVVLLLLGLSETAQG
jgi:hypothetical protein